MIKLHKDQFGPVIADAQSKQFNIMLNLFYYLDRR